MVNPLVASLSVPLQQSNPEHQRAAVPRITGLRRPLLRILFFHNDLADVHRCVQELEHMQFRITTDVVWADGQLDERIASRSFDIALVEYPGHIGAGSLDLLYQNEGGIPVIFLTETTRREAAAELITKGAADCVGMDHISHLPVAIRRALDENDLRKQRDGAEKKLRHSEARYRALVGNLTYGMCRCSVNGKLQDVNPTLATMLGYESREELLALNLADDILCDPRDWVRLRGEAGRKDRFDPVAFDLKRKDGTSLKARFTGREVHGEQDEIDGYEIIAEDVTKQREMEDYLRQQAASDSLTGLANYRQLVDVLSKEVKRSRRTGREFALLFFDLDHLKQINDRYGHATGSQALCRLADALCIGCRDIDTAARFGGDEFALVLPETGAEPAHLAAGRICHNFANDGREPKLSVSVGVAIYPKDGESIDSLLSTADAAMYSMKRHRHGFPSNGNDR